MKHDVSKEFVFSIRKNGEFLGYIEEVTDRSYTIIGYETSGVIGNNCYDSWIELIKGLKGFNIAIDNFYW